MKLKTTTKFNPRNAVLEDYLDSTLYPPRLEVNTMQPLSEALESGALAPKSELLTFEYGGQLMAFPIATVVCYNLIQGQLNDQAWMISFCNACNTGMVFNPSLNDQSLRFHRRGSYNGLLLIWDDTTDSYWHHITGEALHGDSAGQQLDVLTTTRHMSAEQALASHANARVLLTTPSEGEVSFSYLMQKMRKKPEKIVSSAIDILVYEDTRLPRFDLGLGIWNNTESIYYQLRLIYANNNLLVTKFEGRALLIYQAPDSLSPIAVYLDGVTGGEWHGNTLRLDNGGSIRDDQYTNPQGEIRVLDRPMQLLMHWYGFALTFQGCEIATA